LCFPNIRKTTLNLKSSTPNCMIYGELGRYPLYIDIKQRMVSYWTKLITGKQSKMCSVVYRLMYHLCRQNSVWTMHGRINRPAQTWPWKFPLQTNIVRHDEKTNRAISIDHVTLNMYKHPIKSCNFHNYCTQWKTKVKKIIIK
jgi:hypothetical protein